MPAYACSGCGYGCVKIIMYPPDAPVPEGCGESRPGVTAAWSLWEPKKKTRRNRR